VGERLKSNTKICSLKA